VAFRQSRLGLLPQNLNVAFMANDQPERNLDISVMPKVHPSIRYTFYAFIMATPFETAYTDLVTIVGTIPLLIGIVFIGVALLQPRICFAPPPGAFWCFAGYVFAYAIIGTTQTPMYAGPMFSRLLTLIQMLVLVWISYNLFKFPEICKGALLAFAASCTILSMLLIFGISAESAKQGRTTMFADNPNSVGITLALGLIALLGITYGRMTVEKKLAPLAWTCVAVMGIALAMTGSRGALIGLVSGIAVLVLKEGSAGTKLKAGLIGLSVIAFLVWASYTNEAMRDRWENTWYEGDVAKRDQIMPQAWAMFLERPVLGWGPVSYMLELGDRTGVPKRDAHNLYLMVLIETGLLGAIPFFAGLWLSLRSAWRARSGREGASPMAMIVCILIINISGQMHLRKMFWVLIAYVLASAWSLRQVSQHQPVRFSDTFASRGSGTSPSPRRLQKG